MVVPATGIYNKLLEQQTNSVPYLQGETTAVRVGNQDLIESFARSVQQVEDDDASVVLSIGLLS